MGAHKPTCAPTFESAGARAPAAPFSYALEGPSFGCKFEPHWAKDMSFLLRGPLKEWLHVCARPHTLKNLTKCLWQVLVTRYNDLVIRYNDLVIRYND